MRKSRLIEEHIIGALKDHAAALSAEERPPKPCISLPVDEDDEAVRRRFR
jgi:hypothetical protein